MTAFSYKRTIVTSALPYANGPLHFGHLTGVYLPADIYTRHLRLKGEKVIHISGSDEHGVAIMLAAEKEKKSYQLYVDDWNKNHEKLFKDFWIDFDFFGRTSSEYHRVEVIEWFKKLNEAGWIGEKSESQQYCKTDKKFLPDRYVEGTCYNCNYAHARGDECPNCGEWIDAVRLKNPICKICGGKEIEIREARHFYLLLSKFDKIFRAWFSSKTTHWRKVVVGFVQGLLEAGLVDRAISRDLEWGIDVPLPNAKGKKLYVWFDAPIGYVSNTKEYLKQSRSTEHYLDDWWHHPETRICHFIGKDNIIFHALIWPCMAMGTNYILPPTDIPANEFLNLEGKQFSKSQGWYVDSRKALDTFGSDALRFYLFSIIPENGDTSFSWDGFATSNVEFGNKIGNFVHRSLSFIEKNYPNGLSAQSFNNLDHFSATEEIKISVQNITQHIDRMEFVKAYVEIMKLGQRANEVFHADEPWKIFKTDHSATEVILAKSVIYMVGLLTALTPVVPQMCEKMLRMFKGVLDASIIETFYQGDWSGLAKCFQSGFRLGSKPEVLVPRVDPQVIAKWKQDLST